MIIDWEAIGWCPHCVYPAGTHHPMCQKHILGSEGISTLAGDLAQATKPDEGYEMSTTRAVVEAAAALVEYRPYMLVMPCPGCSIDEARPCARCSHPKGVHHLRDADCEFFLTCGCDVFEPYEYCPVDCRGGWIIREELLRVALRELESVRSVFDGEDQGRLEILLREAFFAIDAAARTTE